MDPVRWLYSAWRNLSRKSRLDEELDEELRSYVELLTEEKVRHGMGAGEARRAALIEVGGVEQVKERVRGARAGAFMETFFHDIRYGARALRKSPGFTFVAVLTLALGIGANTAIFSVTDAVLLRPLPYREPYRLVTVWESSARSEESRSIVSPANYLDWREQNRVFEEMGAYTEDFFNLSEDTSYPERVAGARVTPSLFQTLRAEPSLGRTFLPEEGLPGEHHVVILSYGLWQRRFGADPHAVGKTVKVNGADHVVVGVLPRDFIISPRAYDLYVPLAIDDGQRMNRRGRYLTVVARLRPGITVEQARAEMKAVGTRLAEEYPDENAGRSASVVPMERMITWDSRTALLVLLGAVSFILLIACVNVANLLLGRAAARRKEMAVRAALGAGRLRLARQLLTESLLLSLAGGALGLLIAKWGTGLLVSLSPSNIPRVEQAGLDSRVLIFTLLVSALVGLLFGLVPALQASKVDLNEALKDGSKATAGARQSFTRSALVVAEVALSLVLLVGAGLLIKSFVRLSEVELGFDPQHVVAADISLPYRYNTPSKHVEFYRELLTRVRSLPGVSYAAVSQSVPLSGEEHGAQFTIAGRQPPGGVKYGSIYHRISSQYLDLMGIRLLKGRGLTDGDTAEAPGVALINEVLARKYFPGEDPIGKRIIVDRNPPYVLEIVGVVSDLRYVTPTLEPVSEIYVSYLADPWQHMSLAVRASGDPTALVSAVRAQVTAMDRDVPLANVKMMEQYVADSMSPQRFSAVLLTLFACAAMALAALGVYGVISGSVTQRTHEIGVRMALGAQGHDVLRMVVRQGMTLALAGVSVGLLGALALTRLMSGLLYGVSAIDPLTFAGVSLLLMLVALFACLVPARRAAKVDPMVALRYE